MREQEQDKQKFVETLESQFTIEGSCRAIHLPRSTFYRWFNEDKEFRKDVKRELRRAEEKMNDIAESKLINKISEDALDAIKFWLSRRSPKFKPMREQREIEGEFQKKLSPFYVPPLGSEDIEY